MNLHDVVPLTKTPNTKQSAVFLAEMEAKRNATIAAMNVIVDSLPAQSIANRDTMKETLRLLCKIHNDRLLASSADAFAKTGVLSPTGLNTITYDHYYLRISEKPLESSVTKMNSSPRSKIGALKELAAKAGMIIIPFSYLNRKSYSSEMRSTVNSIAEFDEASKNLNMATYVICPIRHYSLINHLKSKNPNLPIIANEHQIHFDTMAMMMPALLMMEDRITGLEGDTKSLLAKFDTLDQATRNIVRGMESMEKRLDALAKTVEDARRVSAEAVVANTESHSAAMLSSVASARTRSADLWFMPYDPLMFSVHGELDDAGTAYLGPCWGPDIPELVIAAADLKMVAGQRRKIETQIRESWM